MAASGPERGAAPPATLVGLVESEAALLSYHGSVTARDSRVLAQLEEDAQGCLGVIGRAVSVLERDAEPRRHVSEGARPLLLLQLAGPDERVDPLDVAAQGR